MSNVEFTNLMYDRLTKTTPKGAKVQNPNILLRQEQKKNVIYKISRANLTT